VRGELFESFIGDKDDWAGGEVGHLILYWVLIKLCCWRVQR
jgi:hypothetical protein